MLLAAGPYLIPFLFLLCFGGLAWVIGHSMRDASEQYASVYMTETARELENLFLCEDEEFCPRQVRRTLPEMRW